MSNISSKEKKEDWRKKIHSQQISGLSIRGWCSQHKIPPGTFHYWKTQLTKSASENKGFIELQDKSCCTICVEIGNVRLRLESATLAQGLKILEGISC